MKEAVVSPESVLILNVHGAKINVALLALKGYPSDFYKDGSMRLAESFPLKCNLSIMINMAK